MAGVLGDVSFDKDLQEEIGREVRSILREDVVLTFLLPELRVTVFRRRIRGLVENRCRLWNTEGLWVEE